MIILQKLITLASYYLGISTLLRFQFIGNLFKCILVTRHDTVSTLYECLPFLGTITKRKRKEKGKKEVVISQMTNIVLSISILCPVVLAMRFCTHGNLLFQSKI